MLTDLLLYQATGPTLGEFNMAQNGFLRRFGEHRNWRSSWTQIVPGNFGGDTGLTDLLFYDPTTGTGEFYATDGHGGIRLIQQHTDWLSSWTHIVPGNFGGDGLTDLLFCAANGGSAFPARGTRRLFSSLLQNSRRTSFIQRTLPDAKGARFGVSSGGLRTTSKGASARGGLSVAPHASADSPPSTG